jgi:integrase
LRHVIYDTNYWKSFIFDGIVGCAVGASMQGAALPSQQPASNRKRVSLEEIARRPKAMDLLRWTREADPFLVSSRAGRSAISFSRHTLRKRFRTACKVLGAERLDGPTIHHGRHTFISHALAGGRTLAEVRDAAGHANVSITSTYLHVAVEDDVVGTLFEWRDDL